MATVVAFAPALRGPQIFDDPTAIQDNPSIDHLWPISRPLPSTPTAGRPVANYSLALDHAFNRLIGVDQQPDPGGPDKTVAYHCTELLLHLAAGLLLFGIVRRTLLAQRYRERWRRYASGVALFVTGLWLLHPIQTEAVDYLAQRSEVLVSCFYLATLYASIRAWDAGSDRARRRWYAAGVAACLLGMGSKEVMVSAPLMVMLYDRAFRLDAWRALRGDAMRGRRRYYLGLWAALLALLALLLTSPRGGTVGFHNGVSWWRYFLSQGWAIVHYLRLVVVPFGFNLDYGTHPFPIARALPGIAVLVVLALLTLLAWRHAGRWGWLGFLGAWFFCILAPSSSFVPIVTEIAAERRVYLAVAAVLAAIAVGLLLLLERAGLLPGDAAPDDHATLPRAVPVAAVLLLAGCGALTFRRSTLYAEPRAIWQDAVRRDPDNWRAITNLGTELEKPPHAGPRVADSLFRRATALDSSAARPWYNLAMSQVTAGNKDSATVLLKRALQITPGDADALAAITDILLGRGDAAGALNYLQPIAADALDGHLLVNLGVAYMGVGRADQAAAAFRTAIRQNPYRDDALRWLGALLTEEGHADQGVPLLERAVAAAPQSPDDLALLSLAYAETGRMPEATAMAMRAVAIPDANAQALYYAGRTLLTARRPDQAEAALQRAVTLKPGQPDMLTALGEAKAALGKTAEAAALFQQALKLDPNDAEAKQGLAGTGG